MKVSKEARKGARSLFKASLRDGRLDPQRVSEVLSKVSSSRPSGHFYLLREYQRLVRLEVESRTAVVESAGILSHEQEQTIARAVQSRLGSDVRAVFSLDSELIGGIRIRIGSDVYESSVRSRLASLRWALSH